MNNRTSIFLTFLALGSCVATRAATPALTHITMAPPLTITIQSELGLTNQIQTCTSLNQSNWVVLTNLLVAQSPYAYADTISAPSAQRFYRVVAVPKLPGAPAGMVPIPAGSFTMGNCMGANEGYENEFPTHTVTLSWFYMDANLVSKAQWDTVCEWAINHGYDFSNAGSGKATNHPVQNVSWYDVVKWCNARSEKEQRTPAYYTSAEQTTNSVYRSGWIDVSSDWVKWNAGYRLPTEAEWERAARGGVSGHRFPWPDTDSITHERANYFSATTYDYDTSLTRGYPAAFNDAVFPYTSPVGCFAANGYGLHDMAGNVWQWCWDWFDDTYYIWSSDTDPLGPSYPSTGGRALRGGAWFYNANDARTAHRINDYPDYTDHTYGFRCVAGF